MVKLVENDITGNVGRDKFIKSLDQTILTAKAIIDSCEKAKRAATNAYNRDNDYEEDTVECLEYDNYTDYTPVDVAYTTACEAGMCALSLMNVLNYLGLDSDSLKNSAI